MQSLVRMDVSPMECGIFKEADPDQLENVMAAFHEQEVCIAHLSNHCNARGGSMSEVVGTLLTTSMYWSFQHGRCLLPKEALQVQGVPILSHPEMDSSMEASLKSNPVLGVVDKLSAAEIKQLAGNAINACVAASIVTWIVANYAAV